MIRVLVITKEPIHSGSNYLLDEKHGIVFVFTDGYDTGFSLLNEMKPDIIYTDWMIGNASALMFREKCVRASINSKVIFIISRTDIPLIGTEDNSLLSDIIYQPVTIDSLTEHACRICNSSYYNEETELIINHEEHQAYVKGVNCKLSETEYRLLEYLDKNRYKVCTREALAKAVFGSGQTIDECNINVYINRLRNKLELDRHTGKKYIFTVRGVGYQFLKE